MESLPFDLRLKYEHHRTKRVNIARGKVHKIFTIIMHTSQMTQATSLLETRPKQIFDIGYDQLTPNMAIILSIHALYLGRVMSSQKHWQ